MSDDEVDEDSDESSLFIGGQSPLYIFDYQLQSLFSVVELARVRAADQPNLYRDVMRRATEVSLVGALGFFEAFCKHQFAALLAIHPDLLVAFANRRPEASIPLSSLVPGDGFAFSLAERHDFGSAKRVNGLFRDLLNVSPLSKDQGDWLDSVLRKRHLIVHHGGFYTHESFVAAARASAQSGKPFRESVVLEADEYFEIADELVQLAVKTATSTVAGLRKVTNDLAGFDRGRRHAVQLLLRAVWDEVAP